MKVKFTYLIVALFFAIAVNAQFDKGKFLNSFYKAGIKEKVRLAASIETADLKVVYPQIKDTLQKIKQLIYSKSESREAKFLIDLIEARNEFNSKNYTKCAFIIENSLQNHASNINDSIRAYALLKTSFAKMRNFFKAYEVNSKMDQLWPRKDDSLKVEYGVNKSGLFASLNLMQQAITERRIEFSKLANKSDTNKICSFYNDLGVYYNRLKNSDSAQHYFYKAQALINTQQLPENKKNHGEFFKALIKGNLGLSYYNSGDIKKCIPLLKEDIYYSLKHKMYESAFNSYNLMTECYIKQNNLGLAKKNMDSAGILLNTHLKDVTPRLNYLYLQLRYYQFAGDYKRSNDCFSEYFKLKDSLTTIEKDQNIRNTEFSFKIQQKEEELFEKNRIIEQKKLAEAKQKTFKAYAFAGILMLLAVILFLVMNNSFSKKRAKELAIKNEQIKSQNLQIEQSLKEKELLIREIHHRVKNNLQIITSMLSLQIAKEENKENEAVLREAKQRISSIALTHQMLYQNTNLSKIPLNQYIESLTTQIRLNFPASGFKLTTVIPQTELKLNIDMAIPLGLILNELLTNAYKHAFPNNEKGFIKVCLEESSDYCMLTVEDNGVGLPADFSSSDRKSMGMDLIHILVDQVGAELIIENKNGSKFLVKISKNKLLI